MQVCRYMHPRQGVRVGAVHQRHVVDVTDTFATIMDLLSHPRPEALLAATRRALDEL